MLRIGTGISITQTTPTEVQQNTPVEEQTQAPVAPDAPVVPSNVNQMKSDLQMFGSFQQATLFKQLDRLPLTTEQVQKEASFEFSRGANPAFLSGLQPSINTFPRGKVNADTVALAKEQLASSNPDWKALIDSLNKLSSFDRMETILQFLRDGSFRPLLEKMPDQERQQFGRMVYQLPIGQMDAGKQQEFIYRLLSALDPTTPWTGRFEETYSDEHGRNIYEGFGNTGAFVGMSSEGAPAGVDLEPAAEALPPEVMEEAPQEIPEGVMDAMPPEFLEEPVLAPPFEEPPLE